MHHDVAAVEGEDAGEREIVGRHGAEVAASIAKVGLLQIPVGRLIPPAQGSHDGLVQLAFGHTRLAAVRKNGNLTMPVDVRVLTDEQMFELAVRENLERKDLTPIEEARAMAHYRDDFHKTSEEIGELFHLSGSAVRNKMRLLELPAPVQAQVEGGQIGEGTARKLLAVQRLAPERVEEAATELADGGFDTSDRISDEIGRVLQAEAFCMLSSYDAKRTGGDDDDDPDDKVRAGKGLWPLGWKAAVKGPGARKPSAILAEKGFFPREDLWRLRQIDSHLQGHPDMNKTPGIDVNTGSLGQGASVAVGLALAAKYKKADYGVYTVIGDGESQEGMIWEAAMSAAHYSLDNLTVLMDHNGLQIDGSNDSVMGLGDIMAKYSAFGFECFKVDGHDIDAIVKAIHATVKGKPKFICCETVKGKGVSFMEDNAGWHGRPMKADEYAAAMKEIGGSDGM